MLVTQQMVLCKEISGETALLEEVYHCRQALRVLPYFQFIFASCVWLMMCSLIFQLQFPCSVLAGMPPQYDGYPSRTIIFNLWVANNLFTGVTENHWLLWNHQPKLTLSSMVSLVLAFYHSSREVTNTDAIKKYGVQYATFSFNIFHVYIGTNHDYILVGYYGAQVAMLESNYDHSAHSPVLNGFFQAHRFQDVERTQKCIQVFIGKMMHAITDSKFPRLWIANPKLNFCVSSRECEKVHQPLLNSLVILSITFIMLRTKYWNFNPAISPCHLQKTLPPTSLPFSSVQT